MIMPHDHSNPVSGSPRPAPTLDAGHGKASSDVTINKDEDDWDEIAESSWESFPASDPPSWAGQGSRAQRRQTSKGNPADT